MARVASQIPRCLTLMLTLVTQTFLWCGDDDRSVAANSVMPALADGDRTIEGRPDASAPPPPRPPHPSQQYARFLTCGASTLWDHSRLLEGTSTFLWPLTTYLNELKRKRSPLN
ncbi:hypothetical protein Tco_0715399 [Tanacetum coccineum]